MPRHGAPLCELAAGHGEIFPDMVRPFFGKAAPRPDTPPWEGTPCPPPPHLAPLKAPYKALKEKGVDAAPGPAPLRAARKRHGAPLKPAALAGAASAPPPSRLCFKEATEAVRGDIRTVRPRRPALPARGVAGAEKRMRVPPTTPCAHGKEDRKKDALAPVRGKTR